MWQAVRVASEAASKELITRSSDLQGDWKLLFFLLTDGKATNQQESTLAEFYKVRWGIKVCCGTGSAVNFTTLKKFQNKRSHSQTASGKINHRYATAICRR